MLNHANGQVLPLLHPISGLDTTIQMGTFARRSGSSSDNGIILPPNGSIICFQPRTHSTDQWSIFLRIQPNHICNIRELSADGCRARSRWKSVGGKRSQVERG